MRCRHGWATAHHLLLSHGRAVEILRANSPESQIGITLNLDTSYPASDSEEDAAATRWVDGLHNRWFLDPIFRGHYPEDMAEAWAEIMPKVRDGDLETISAPIDFPGVNNYTSPLVAADENGAAYPDVRGHDGSVNDPERQSYLQAYLAGAARALAQGVPLRGYFA